MKYSASFVCVACGCIVALGCGADDGSKHSGPGGSLAGAGNGAAGVMQSFAGSGNFGDGSGAAGSGDIVMLTPDGGEVCGASSQAAKQVVTDKTVEVEVEVSEAQPVALYLMVDNSGSMSGWVASAGKSRWEVVVAGITALVNDPKSANVDIAVQYFPSSIGDACDGNAYSMPSVPMGRLPGNAANVTASLAKVMPYGDGTPTEGALRGLSKFCAGFQASHPEEKCVAVLITDGDPNGCDENLANLAGIAAAAKANDDVLTYAIGVEGSSFTFLDAVAAKGGTDCSPGSAGHNACDATAGMQFQASLETIRDHVVTVQKHTEVQQIVQQIPLPCTWNVPVPNVGQSFDANKVNVQFTADAAGTPKNFGHVAHMNACGSHADAWYYDDPNAPKQIIACPGTCDAVKAASAGKIDILLGCKTFDLE